MSSSKKPSITKLPSKDGIRILHGGDTIIKQGASSAHHTKSRLLNKTSTEDDHEEDPLTWISRIKKNKPKQQAAPPTKDTHKKPYTQEDIRGLKVAHSLGDFSHESSEILHLSDAPVLVNDDDSESVQTSHPRLVSTHLLESASLRRSLSIKKRLRKYKGYDDDDNDGQYHEDQNVKRRSLLPQYDHPIDKHAKMDTGDSEEDGFILGQANQLLEEASKKKSLDETEKGVKESLFSSSNLYSRQRDDLVLTDDQQGNGRQAFAPIPPPKNKKRTVPLNDEDDIELDILDDSLSKARKQAISHLRKKAKSAQEAKRDHQNTIKIDLGQYEGASHVNDTPSIIFSDVTEFVDRISQALQEKQSVNKGKDQTTEKMAQGVAFPIQSGDHTGDQKETPAAKASSLAQKDAASDTNETSSPIGDEPLVSRGVADTLRLLYQKGLIHKPSAQDHERRQAIVKRQRWISQQKKLEILSKASRPKKGKQKEPISTSSTLLSSFDRFKDYQPDVQLSYTDSYGRALTPKEAFKILSHKFHGIESGKMKTEKLLKKIQTEKILMGMPSQDTPLHSAQALQQKTKESARPHVIISSSSRDATPSLLSPAKTFLEKRTPMPNPNIIQEPTETPKTPPTTQPPKPKKIFGLV